MKKISFTSLLLIATLLSSCTVIGDIFKAGMWTGFIIIFLIVALVIWIISKARGPRA